MDFTSILKHFHSGWAYLVIAIGFVLFLAMAVSMMKKEKPSKTLLKISFFATLVFHIQLIVGFLTYFTSPITTATMKDMGAAMKDETLRLYAVEHPLMMVTAVVLITISNAKIKRVDTIRFGNLILVALAMICVLSRIPWNVWMG